MSEYFYEDTFYFSAVTYDTFYDDAFYGYSAVAYDTFEFSVVTSQTADQYWWT